LVCCLIGLSLIPLLSVQLVPSRSYPSVSVSCYLSGASQEVTELELTNPIENVLSGLKGIKSVSSTTGPGSSNVYVELDKWTDPEMFRFEVSSQLRQLKNSLPENASYPQVYLNRPNNNRYRSSILRYSLNGPDDANALVQMAENRMRPILANIKGVYEISIDGAQAERIAIYTHQEKMRAAKLGHQELVNSLREGLSKSTIGMVNTDGQRVEVVTEGSLNTFEELRSFPVKNISGRIIQLQDIAKIERSVQPYTSYYRINGQELVVIGIHAEEHVNTIKLAKEVRETMESIEKELPEGYRLALNYDSTEYIKEELGKIYLRTFLSVAILLLFVLLITRQLRYLLIVVISLAVNVLISFIFYYFFKLEIHLYSLAGITISIGLIIDNVIVIVEDIRHTGKNRIFAAILASTFTALGALSVIFLLEESQRLNLMDFAIAIIINLIVSLPVAYFFIPALLEKLPVLVKKSAVLVKRKRRLVRFSNFYFKQIRFMLKRKWVFVLLLILSFGIPTYLLPDKIEKENKWAETYNRVFGSEFYQQKLKVPINKYLGGTSYLYINSKGGFGRASSSEDEEKVRLFVRVSMPNGATLAQMNEVARDFETYLKQFNQELEVFTTQVSGTN
jgi:multidrug efflux pump subunit AcrB